MEIKKKMHVVFSHGLESGPWGRKISTMADSIKEFGCQIESIDYRGMDDPAARVAKLKSTLTGMEGNIILVGSSMGGYVSTVASQEFKVAAMLLLAPAFFIPNYPDEKCESPCKDITIVHGWGDDIVPFSNSIKFGEQHKARLLLVDDDHRLSSSHALLANQLRRILREVTGKTR